MPEMCRGMSLACARPPPAQPFAAPNAGRSCGSWSSSTTTMRRLWWVLLVCVCLAPVLAGESSGNGSLVDDYGDDDEDADDEEDPGGGPVEGVDAEDEHPWFPSSYYNISLIASMLDNMYCAKWGPANHMYFQMANTFFFLSYLAPNGTYGILYLRCTLLVGCALYALWGWTVLCSLDAFLWNANFVAINFIHVCVLLYYLRPVKFSREIEEVYLALFYPLKVSRHQFKKVLNCMKEIRPLRYQEVYAHEKSTKVDSLSLVLSGKLVVSQNGRALHIVFPHQFLDSPEWFGVSTDEYFQVSITAMEEARVLLWHRDKLKLSIITDQFLQAVFDHILGRDVVKKLMQVSVSETMAASNNGNLPNSFDDAEDKPMLLIKKPGDGPGISALINRQIQAADPNAWRLGRIDETDHETTV